MYPCGTDLPGTSTVNFAAGQTIANAATTRVGAGGKLEALETLRSDDRQPIIVRRLPEDDTGWQQETLAEIAHECGCSLEQFSGLEVLIIAPSEERIAVFVHRLVGAGVRIVQVSPPTRRLEHFFRAKEGDA